MMLPEQEDREVLAAEYVLGTLDPEQRIKAFSLRSSDPEFAAIVQAWERRLGELNALVAPVEPPPELWQRLRARMAAAEPVVPAPAAASAPAPSTTEPELPETARLAPDWVPAPSPPEPEPAPAAAVPPPGPEPPHAASGVFGETSAPLSPALRDADIGLIERSRSRWRAAALAMAAALVGFVALLDSKPEVLPAGLRPPARTVQVTDRVEIPSARPAEFVAILSKDGASSPSFLLTFDLDKRILAARAVDVPLYPGKTYQLWMISPKLGRPQSLGVIGAREFTVKSELGAYDPSLINSATYSVSLEPAGSAPSAPSGPMVYSGKLIQTTPIGFRDKAP